MSLDDELGTRLSRKLRSEQLAASEVTDALAPASDAPALDRHLPPDVAPGDVATFVVELRVDGAPQLGRLYLLPDVVLLTQAGTDYEWTCPRFMVHHATVSMARPPGDSRSWRAGVCAQLDLYDTGLVGEGDPMLRVLVAAELARPLTDALQSFVNGAVELTIPDVPWWASIPPHGRDLFRGQVWDYHGWTEAYPQPVPKVDLRWDDTGIEVTSADRLELSTSNTIRMQIPWSRIVDVHVAGTETASLLAAARAELSGIAPYVLPGVEQRIHLLISICDGPDVVVSTKTLSVDKLTKLTTPILDALRTVPQTTSATLTDIHPASHPPAADPDPVDKDEAFVSQLERIAALHDAGKLTTPEYVAAKAKLLDLRK